ncbi:MAG TPA: leucine--tRNA ligase [Pyrinomonadaceae bacterium]|jgi:leucyl-tRNA synthetase|nr:leucine--tRNA ligase [Pyrinomonadaceae bacterium]
MDEKYFAEKVEERWQEAWAASGAFEVEPDPAREKHFYCLEMLPYPSGFLHMGHVRNYSIGDALAWFKRLQGFNVLHPIGWDSFGQPAEQAAIRRGVMPREWTEANIEHMRAQFKRLGLSYDWRREIAAHRPDYYKWDQWFFLKMLERGLAYKKRSPVNWCPAEQTVLSNEQSSGGVCWRCGAAVEKRDIEQWFLRITEYAEQLLDDMREIERGWPERVLTMQRNWIGRSSGAFIDFQIKDTDERVRVFTTRIDTIYGANAIVLAADHPLIEHSPLKEDVRRFAGRVRAARMSARTPGEDEEKEGLNTGLLAVNPFSGEQIPVWAANYVLMEYGTGAVMSVPAHDERDFEFAQKYSLPIRRVIGRASHEQPAVDSDPANSDQSTAMKEAFTEYGILVNSGDWSGKLSETAVGEMAAFAQQQGFGEPAVTYRLRDWGVSRQRFWGAPIPVIYCERCGVVPVPESELPVVLPERAEFTGAGQSPLAGVAEFVNTSCPKCGGKARRETDTMDTFVDSSWYFFRYCDPENSQAPFDVSKVAYWTPVDQYIGGVEHAVMHLLYTRFWTKFMRDTGLVSFNEPVKRLMTQGMVVAETFYREGEDAGQKIYFNPAEVDVVRDERGRIASATLVGDGLPVAVGPFEKMSKSTNNGVDPNEMISAYGTDATRLFVLFAAPVENDLRWQEAGIDGALRFLRRVYSMVFRWHASLGGAPKDAASAGEFSAQARRLRHETHRTIARVTEDFEGLRYNTAVAALMELSNAMGDFKASPESAGASDLFAVREALEALVLMLAPFCPHVSEEMWEGLGHVGGLLRSGARWPRHDEQLARKDELEIAVQVNGKLRGRVVLSADASEDETRAAALADERVRAWTEGKQIVKTVVIPGRLVNVVVR